MQQATVCFLARERDGHAEVCLVEKKRGYGKGLLVGYGGKKEAGELAHDSIRRELREEAGVIVHHEHLKWIASLHTFSENSGHAWKVDVFICDTWRKDPKESEECGVPQWYLTDQLPFDRMFPDASYWMKRVLSRQDGETITILLSPEGTVWAYFPQHDMDLRHRYP
jgi:8-oxo-dGTP diphosphatase